MGGVAFLAIAGAIALLVEAAARQVVTVNPETGVPRVGRVALLPYIADRAVATRAWEDAGSSTYIVRDDELGWTLRPNGAAAMYTSNSDGLRGRIGDHVSPSLPADRLRVSVYGDSFTHGDGVGLDDTWPEQLQRHTPEREVLNFGVPAYGMDQALLRFRRDGRRFAAHLHMLGIWPEDIVRNLSVIRFYLTPEAGLGTSKPRFLLGAVGLELINSPVLSAADFLDAVSGGHVPSLERVDFWRRPGEQRFLPWYHAQFARVAASIVNAYERRELRRRMYFDRDGEALRLATALAEQFSREVREVGAQALVAILPMRDLLDEQADGRFPLAEMMRARDVAVVDVASLFAARARERQAGLDTMFMSDGHLTAAGNRVVAEILDEALPRLAAVRSE